MRAGKHEQARSMLLEATRQNFTNPTDWQYLTLSYSYTGKLDEARVTLSQAQTLVRLNRQTPNSKFTWHDTRQWELLIKDPEARLPPPKASP